jgi:hypothetical protein
MAVSDRIPAVTGNGSGMWLGAQALRRPLKFSGPPRPSSSTGRPGLVRETLTSGVEPSEAAILRCRRNTPARPYFSCLNKGFAAHKFLHPTEGEVIDRKEGFSI